MSNIAGKAYAMNLVTPIKAPMVLINKLIFWLVGTPLFSDKLKGLLTLSLIHYARWVILRAEDFPRLDESQPREELDYGYMLFFSNFNGSWEQYVDSFSAAIPSGLNLLWYKNVGWPTAVPEQPFHAYVSRNQIWTDYYYNAYPMASSNDVKSAKRVKDGLCELVQKTAGASPEAFVQQYNALLKRLQHDLGQMAATPIVSLAAQDVLQRRRGDEALRVSKVSDSGPVRIQAPRAPAAPAAAGSRSSKGAADA
jgi:hypothetical protein